MNREFIMGVHRTLGRRFGLLGTSMLGAMIVAAPAFAQEAPQSATEGANDASGEIIVTATRKSEALSKVPLSVSAFSTETLDKRGVRDFSDVIRQTPVWCSKPPTPPPTSRSAASIPPSARRPPASISTIRRSRSARSATAAATPIR
jgi:hypothetical protein